MVSPEKRLNTLKLAYLEGQKAMKADENALKKLTRLYDSAVRMCIRRREQLNKLYDRIRKLEDSHGK